MRKIREFAKSVGHEVVGKIVRRPDLEYDTDWYDGSKKWSGYRSYVDEAGNEYIIGKTGVCIVTVDGGVI